MKKLMISNQTRQLFVYLFSIIVLLLIVFSILLYNGYNANGIKLIQSYNQKLNQQILHNYENMDKTITNLFLNKTNSDSIINLMYSKSLNMFDTNRLVTTIGHEMNSYPMYHSAIIYNNQIKKNYLFNISESASTNILSNIYQGDKIPRLTSVPVEITNSSGDKELLFSYYFYDFVTDDSVCDGAYILNINTKWIKELLKTTDNKDLNVIFANNQGRIIFDSKDQFSFNTVLDRPYMKDLLNGSKSEFICKIDGEKTVVSVAKIAKTDWFLIYEQPFSIYAQTMKPVQKLTIILTVILALFSFVFAFMIAKHVYNPLQKLVDFVKNTTGADKNISNDYKYIESAFKDINYEKNQLAENTNFITKIKKQNYLKGLIEEGYIDDDLLDTKECFDFLKGGNIFAVLLKVYGKIELNNLVNIWDEWSVDKFTAYEVIHLNDQEIMVIIKESSMNNLRDKFLSQSNELQKQVQEQSLVSMSIFFTKYYTFQTINQITNEINKLKRYEIMYSKGCCLNNETIDLNHEKNSFNYPVNVSNKLLNSLKNKKMDESELYFDDLLMEIITNDIDGFLLALTKLALSIQSLYEESSFNKNNELYNEITNIVSKIMNLNGMDEVRTYFLSLFELLCNDSVVSGNKNKVLANSIADYINVTYRDFNLDLNSIALVFKLSANYIGKVFKDEMNVSVSNYVNNVRLGVSLNLLKNTNKSIKEIIEEVGFINESGYYKLFKKAYGITPKEFRLDKALAEQVINSFGISEK